MYNDCNILIVKDTTRVTFKFPYKFTLNDLP